jgi:hypothetical protein
LMYTTKRYSAKIYHKGSEYEKNDRKEHLKINRERGCEYFKTSHFQQFADRILRYELTIRTHMLNYLHKRDIFRKNCPYYQNACSTYQQVENAKQKNERIAKKVGSLAPEEREQYLKEHPYEKITKEARVMHKYVSRLITTRTYFMLDIQEQAKIYNRVTVNYSCNTAKFSKALHRLCLNKLIEFINEFQIKELPEEEKVKRLVEQYNLINNRKLPETEMSRFYTRLKEVGSFKETARFFSYSRATLYRYRDWFKKIGITESNVIPITSVGVPKATIDFLQYHSIVNYNPCFIKSNTLLF